MVFLHLLMQKNVCDVTEYSENNSKHTQTIIAYNKPYVSTNTSIWDHIVFHIVIVIQSNMSAVIEQK